MSKYKLYTKDFQIWKKHIHILPTVVIRIGVPEWMMKGFEIQFHFLVFHARFLWLEEGAE